MADGFDLADFGEAIDAGADVFGAERFGGVHRRHVELGELVGLLAGGGALEEQRLVLGNVGGDLVDQAITSWGCAWGLAAACAASTSMSARLLISVAQSSMQSLSSG